MEAEGTPVDERDALSSNGDDDFVAGFLCGLRPATDMDATPPPRSRETTPAARPAEALPALQSTEALSALQLTPPKPVIRDIKPDPDTLLRLKPIPHVDDEAKLMEAVRSLAEPHMDPLCVVLIVNFLKSYFSPRIGSKPTELQLEIARTLLANKHVDEDLRAVLRNFYNIMWLCEHS
jgi:hypothetical protein